MVRVVLALASLFVALLIAASAYVEHGLKTSLNPVLISEFHKAFWYFITHVIILFTLVNKKQSRFLQIIVCAFFIGAFLFSGSLVLHVFFGVRPLLAPLGGSLLIATWVALAAYFFLEEK